MRVYDVAIAGGGPAGAAAAVGLARAGRTVLLADAGREGGAPIGEGLPPSARSLLRELGVLAATLAGGHRPSHGTASAWGSPALHVRDFLFEPNGPGWQLDRTHFDAMLRRAAADAGADIREGARLTLADVREDARLTPTDIREDTRLTLTDVREDTRLAPADDAPPPADGAPPPAGGPLRLRLRGGPGAERAAQEVGCHWLIDAGGRPAALTRRLGATRRRDDRLVAFYLRLRAKGHVERGSEGGAHGGTDASPPRGTEARAKEGSDRDGRTLVEAVEDGWWYSVLLPDGERLVARLGDADLLDRRRLLGVEGLWSSLGETQHLRRLCAEYGYLPRGPARGADASSSRLEPAAGERWVAVGDAALAFDPLSSKGIASALYTGLRAASAVDAALRGEGGAVERYAAHLLDVYRVYRQQLRAHYAAETRWPDAPFWRRRSATSGP
ncbi:MAG TPA: FAD-dependent monooxygenase [Polyangiaceae bacterium]|nr:FAD-dependent monooxygenase [Polyangiaceae bacterium]